MADLLRADFAEAAMSLVTSSQKRNLKALHDWLVDELEISASETVLAVTNYQQGHFGRLPSHILLVTSERIAFTHDGGMRGVPLRKIDVSKMGLDLGLINGQVSFLLDDGEVLTFKKGVSLAVGEVASIVKELASPSPWWESEPVSEFPFMAAPVAQRAASAPRNSALFEFENLVTGPAVIEITGGRSDENFVVTSIGENNQEGLVLVDSHSHYKGVLIIGLLGPVKALRVDSSYPWSVRMISMEELPTLEGDECSGSGDAVVLLRRDLGSIESDLLLSADIHSDVISALWAYGPNTKLLANQGHSFRGTVSVPPGTVYMSVVATGGWVLSKA